MEFKELRPTLWTNKFQESIDFYTTILGFTVGGKNDEWGWACLQKGTIEIMLSKPNEHTPFDKPIFTGSFYITTDNVSEIWELLRKKTRIVYDLETFDWGMKEFAIYDNNGYIIQFGQDMSIDS